MAIALKRSPKVQAASAWKNIPPVMRVLHITNRARTGGWLAEAFAADSASDVDLQQAIGSAVGLARLRDEAFDAVLVSHEPGALDALELIEGYRAGGAEEPIVVLGSQSEQEMAALCYEVGADAYLCANTTTTRHLIWTVARAVQRHHLVIENRRLGQAEIQRLQREHDEAERLVGEQWAVVEGIGASHDATDASRPRAGAGPQPAAGLPEELVAHYRELLRTYVIMGSGNLACELGQLAQWLATAGVTARQTLRLHLCALEELIRGLGARSTRHVMNRADLLVMEILVELAEAYHWRYRQRVRPPVQLLLPGFDEPLPVAC